MTAIVIITILLGTSAISAVINVIPETVMNGLEKASSLLPAVGFAMLLNIMWDKRFIPLYFVGFALSAYLGWMLWRLRFLPWVWRCTVCL